MIKFLVKLILAIVFLAAGLIFYGIYTYKSRVESYVQEVITTSAKQSGLNLTFDEFRINPTGAKAKALSFFLPKALLSFKLDEPEFSMPIMSAVTMSPAVKFSGKFYESSLDAGANYNINQKTTGGWLKVQNLELNKIPQLAFLSIRAGMVNLDLGELKITDKGPQYLKGGYSIENFSTARATQLPARINQIPLIMPQTDKFNMNGSILFENAALNINNGKIESDLGSAEYQGQIGYNPSGSAGTLKFTSAFNISQKGLQNFGYLLPQISNNILNNNQGRFKLVIEGNLRNLKYSFIPQ